MKIPASLIHRVALRALKAPGLGGMLLLLALLRPAAGPLLAQETDKLYDPSADAAVQLAAAVTEAAASGKHVLVQVGGNWCSWCRKLDRLMTENTVVDSLLDAAYVLTRINYSKENRNLDILEKLQWPQRFGFPVLVVLDGAGSRLHTQDSGLLEKDGGHDPEAVARFLRLWAPSAFNASDYRE